MKPRYIKYWALSLMMASAWSCTDWTEDAAEVISKDSAVKEIVFKLPELKQADTRTQFTVDEVNKTLKTAWAEGDVAGVFPTTGFNQVEFPISDSWGESEARFDGGEWALRANKSYAAYFPFNKANFERDASSIILSYEGQEQLENGSVSHLSGYDYLATGAAQSDPLGSINFQLQRLSGIVRFAFTLPENERSSFIKLLLKANEEVFDVEKTLNITGENPELSTAKSAKRISMNLANISTDENHQIIVFMTLPPMFIEGQVNIMLMKADGSILSATSDGFNVEAAHVQGYTFSDFETIENSNIEFEDESVKAICVENWDTNGDGELGTAEASLVTSLDGKFTDRGNLKSFNELQYFTGLTTIEGMAFEGSGIQEITIPKNIETIGGRAFGYNNLTKVESVNPRFKVYDNCMVIDMVENKLVFNFNDQAIKDVTIPDFVTTIGGGAFAYQFEGVKTVTIPNSVTTIEGGAFEDCRGLESITIPNSVTTIGGYAFSATCYSLKYVYIPPSVTSIGELAFSGVNAETFIIDNSRYSLVDNELLVEDGYKAISCLGSNNILTIPTSITEMGDSFYWYCPNIMIMESATPPSFDGNFCHPENFVIYVSPENVETYKKAEGWSNYAEYIRQLPEWEGNISFADSDVKSFCLTYWDVNKDGELNYLEAGMPTGNFPGPEMSTIGHPYTFNEFQYFTGFEMVGGFYWCGNMTEVSIPSTITSIDGYSGFGYCNGLEKITSYSKHYSVVDECLLVDNRNNQVVFYFNSANHPTVTIPSDITSIGEWAFGHHDGVKNVVIPNSVVRIENHAFCWNNSVETISLPETIDYIGPSAFVGCPSLTSLTINATTPPKIGKSYDSNEKIFDGDDELTIFVPSGSIEVYKNAEGWIDFADKIKAIP